METKGDEPLFIRVKEASKRLGVPVSTVYHFCRTKAVPSVTIGSSVLVSVAGLVALEKRAMGESD
jgi:excisionase family DNA binding protein